MAAGGGLGSPARTLFLPTLTPVRGEPVPSASAPRPPLLGLQSVEKVRRPREKKVGQPPKCYFAAP